jgi:hypothetical protein
MYPKKDEGRWMIKERTEGVGTGVKTWVNEGGRER